MTRGDRWAAAAVGAAILALSIHSLGEHDVFWQLATGDWIAHHGIPSADPFSWAFPDRPWVEMRWLFCVALYALHATLGWHALVLGSAALLAAGFALFLALPGPAWCRSAGAALAVAGACARFAVRPEIVTFVLLLAFLVALERFHATPGSPRRLLLTLVPLQVLWVNVHTLFVLGPVVAALWLAGTELAARLSSEVRDPGDRERRRALRLLVPALGLACLVNPYFLRGALFPLELFAEIRGDSLLGRSISEFLSPFTLPERGAYFFVYLGVGVLAALSFLGARASVSARLPRALVFAAFAYLSALAQRNVALFALVAGVALAANLGEVAAARPAARPRWPRLARALTLLFGVAAVLAATSDLYYRNAFEQRRFGFGLAPFEAPIGALAFLDHEEIAGPGLHDIGAGGAILWRQGARSVFVDGRLEVYGAELLSEHLPLIVNGDGLAGATERLGLRWALVDTRDQPGLLRALEAAPDWVAVYFDAGYVLYLRDLPEHARLLRERRIDWSRPEPAPPPEDPSAPRWRPVFARLGLEAREAMRLGRLYLQVGALGPARAALERGLTFDPDDLELRLHHHLVTRASDPDAAVERRLRELLERPDVRRLGATLAERSGSLDLAQSDYDWLIRHPGARLEDLEGGIRVALARGDLESATRAAREVTVRYPRHRDGWNNLGLLASRTRDAAEAIRAFSASLALERRQPAVWNQLALAHLAAGDRRAAERAFEEALAVDPDYALARSNLDRLRGLESFPTPPLESDR